MKRATPEGAVVRSILDLCARMRAPAWRLNSGAFAIEDGSGKRRFVRASWRGAPDVVALTHQHGTVWIECKSAVGRLTPDQVAFREQCRERGIVYVVARSVDDVLPWIRTDATIVRAAGGR